MMSKAKRGAAAVGGGLQGPRPQPLSLPATSPPRPSKRPRVNGGGDEDDGVVVGVAPAPAAGPVIVYEHTPRVIHARPDEFKALVQRLTGQQQRTTTATGDDQEPVLRLPAETTTAPSREEAGTAAGAGDPLVLTLGKQAPPPPPLDYDHSLALPSPGFLLSPGSFLFSPATMQAIHELIS